jgi:protein-serine/threonine kinase
MLAGYLPFDDDPANPEGDNINLLYKYITTTPLTFPEYVTPHARDLLRRILVPDPRKRADLFEVARHSWLSEYSHVVSHITSSTTNVAEIANTTITNGESCQEVSAEPAPNLEAEDERPMVNRSASVRDVTTKPRASPGALVHTDRSNDLDDDSTGSRRTRHTLQPEYVAPMTHTTRGQALEPIASHGQDAPQVLIPSQSASLSKPLPQSPPVAPAKPVVHQQKMQPPTRPGRDIPRSVSDSTSAFGQIPTTQGGQYATRPSTQGSMVSTGAPPTRPELGLRLPSRGSYGQPVAPTVAATNVQGRVTQPTKTSRGYNISGPIPHPGAQNSIGQPMTTPMPPAEMQQPQKSNHHRRSSTLSNLGERLFGRSNSVVKKDKDTERQKNGRRYPPTAMKEWPSESQPRVSTDSKRSFSFGLGRKKSTDMENMQSEKPVRRFSLIPSSMSIKNLLGAAKDGDSSKPGTPQTDRHPQQTSSRPDTGEEYGGRQASNFDGQYDASTARYNYSRPQQTQQYRTTQAPATQPSNDVYSSTAVYSPNGQSSHQRQQSEPINQMMSSSQNSRPSMQQGRREGRGVLVKNNRKFNEGYAQEQGPTHHSGRSGAVKKVQDFFRRRRAPTDGDYR